MRGGQFFDRSYTVPDSLFSSITDWCLAALGYILDRCSTMFQNLCNKTIPFIYAVTYFHNSFTPHDLLSHSPRRNCLLKACDTFIVHFLNNTSLCGCLRSLSCSYFCAYIFRDLVMVYILKHIVCLIRLSYYFSILRAQLTIIVRRFQ